MPEWDGGGDIYYDLRPEPTDYYDQPPSWRTNPTPTPNITCPACLHTNSLKMVSGYNIADRDYRIDLAIPDAIYMCNHCLSTYIVRGETVTKILRHGEFLLVPLTRITQPYITEKWVPQEPTTPQINTIEIEMPNFRDFYRQYMREEPTETQLDPERWMRINEMMVFAKERALAIVFIGVWAVLIIWGVT